MSIPKKYKNNILYITFHILRITYFKTLVIIQKFKYVINIKFNNILQIKKTILKEKILFNEFGIKNYYFRVKKKIQSINFICATHKIKNDSINTNEIYKILIISGCENTPAEIHRVYHLIEKLKLIKIKYTLIPHSKLSNQNPEYLIKFNLIWIHRAASEPVIDKMVEIWNLLKIPILYDIDDLVFDTKIVPYISAISTWSKEKIELYKETMNRYSSLIKKANFVSSPTNFLSNYMSKYFNIPFFVIRNGIDTNTTKKLEKIKSNIKNNNSIIIAYFSGTNTHDKDFLQCAKALYSIMEKYDNVKLKIIGDLNIPKYFKKFSNRLIKKDLVPYINLYKEYQDIHINIAPLEFNNPYCESKSELKYYFAAFCGIPTIATPTDSYSFAIEDSVNGFLAKNEKEWFQKLEKLIIDRKLYYKISKNCKSHSLNVYSPIIQAEEIKGILLTINKSKI
jgi:glycosyltransferase involved in cell wall biosynthesis